LKLVLRMGLTPKKEQTQLKTLDQCFFWLFS
jgi:hypothetical protein